MCEPQVFIERRARLRAGLESGVVLLPGNGESPINYRDNPYPFRQDSSFLYYFGLDRPGAAGLIDIDESRHVLFADDPTVEEIVWTGPQVPIAELARAAGVAETAGRSALAGAIEKAARGGRNVHILPQYRAENESMLRELLGPEWPSRVSAALTDAVIAQRSFKSAAEVAEIESALEVACDMHVTAMRAARPGAREQEVVGAVEGLALSRGFRTAFPTIFSIRGETLHNPYHGNVMRPGDIAIHDSGAESPLGYASDITRTIPVGGRFTNRQKDVYAIVLASQEGALAAVRPGTPFRDVHALACRVLASGLKDLGLMKGDVGEAVSEGAHALFFPCGVGHMLGLDVHDMEALGEDRVGYTERIRRSPQFGTSSLRLGRELEPGFVVTVEPGLYFIPQLIDRWRAERRFSDFIDYGKVEAFRDFGGIRVEDDVLVTREGSRVLGRPIPRTVPEVEELAAR